MKEEILNFLKCRPECIGILGYGSGVIKQKGYTKHDSPQIDLILIVKNVKEWSLQNIAENPKDYSYTGKLFFNNASDSILSSGGKISYLTYINYKHKKYKYGIINEKDFLNSLTNWDTFYLAGRCQKNCLIVKSNEIIDNAIEYNRYMALVLSLFLNKNNKNLKEYDLYKTICSLSYIGDSRQGIAENPNKINNILKKNFNSFRTMYFKYNLYGINYDGTIINNLTVDAFNKLPSCILNEIIHLNCYDEQVKKIKDILIRKNKRESLVQTTKGIFSAGIKNSVSYGFEKIKKAQKK